MKNNIPYSSDSSVDYYSSFFSEQATVGVRQLQHFLCKDPTAYGATGQNWIPFLLLLVQPLTVPGNLCLAHLQWLSKPKNQKTKKPRNQKTKKPKHQKTKKPKNQKKQKKQKDKTQHSASDPLPLGCAILVFL